MITVTNIVPSTLYHVRPVVPVIPVVLVVFVGPVVLEALFVPGGYHEPITLPHNQAQTLPTFADNRPQYHNSGVW